MYKIKGELVRKVEDTKYDFIGWLMVILMIVLFVLVAIIIIILLAAVISGIIDNKISSKEYVTTNIECIAREKSTDLSVLPISTGETVSMLPHYSDSYKTVFQYKGMKLAI